MSTVVTLARKDLTEFVRDRRLLLLAALVVVLALTAVAAAYVRVAAYEADRVATERRDRVTWESQGERNPHSAAHFATWALRPLTPLALLDPGATPFAGSAIWMEAHNQNPARARTVEDAASAFDLGVFSAAWVLQILVPLLIGVIAAGAVARERERGTLRLLLANGAPVRRIVPGKLLALSGTVALLVVPVLLAAVIAALAAGPLAPLRLLLWVAAYAAFFGILSAIAVAVSVAARTVSQALLLLIGLWLLAALLLPRAGAGLAESLAPTPQADQFWAAVGADRATLPKVFGPDAAAFGASMAEQYGVASVEDLPVFFGGLQLEEDERLNAGVFEHHFGRLADHYRQQRQLLRISGLLTPVTSLQNVSMALAGTDMAHQLAFQDQAEAHRREMVGALNRDLILHGREAGFDYTAGAELWQATADFRFAPPGLGATLRSIVADLAILLAWALGAALLLRSASQRLAREVL